MALSPFENLKKGAECDFSLSLVPRQCLQSHQEAQRGLNFSVKNPNDRRMRFKRLAFLFYCHRNINEEALFLVFSSAFGE